MSGRPFTVNLYVSLALATNVAWAILGSADYTAAMLPADIARWALGALVLWRVWQGDKNLWILVVVLNGWTLVWTTLALVFEGSSVESGTYLLLAAAKLGLLLHPDTRAWMSFDRVRAEAV